MKSAIRDIVGKRIAHVVVKEGARSQLSQVFLVFDDETYQELYAGCGSISGAGGVDPGGLEAVRRYMSDAQVIVLEV